MRTRRVASYSIQSKNIFDFPCERNRCSSKYLQSYTVWVYLLAILIMTEFARFFTLFTVAFQSVHLFVVKLAFRFFLLLYFAQFMGRMIGQEWFESEIIIHMFAFVFVWHNKTCHSANTWYLLSQMKSNFQSIWLLPMEIGIGVCTVIIWFAMRLLSPLLVANQAANTQKHYIMWLILIFHWAGVCVCVCVFRG